MKTDQFRRWLNQQSSFLKRQGEHPESDLLDCEEAAGIVQQARQMALDHNFPKAHEVSNVRSGPLAIDLARFVLSQMIQTLPANDETIAADDEAKAVNDAIMTVSDVGEYLAVNDKTIYALCSSGDLKHTRIGQGRGTIRIRREDLRRYLEQNQSRSAGTPDFLA